MPTTQQHNPLRDLATYQLDASMGLANAVFSAIEKIDSAVLDVAHHMLDAQLKLTRLAADMRDQSRMSALQESIVCRPDKTIQCNQQIMSAVIEIQAELGRSARQYLERISQLSRDQLEQLANQAETQAHETPADQLSVVNPIVGMLSVWRDAFQEVGHVVDENLAHAGSSLEAISDNVHEMANPPLELTQTSRSRSLSSRKRQGISHRKS